MNGLSAVGLSSLVWAAGGEPAFDPATLVLTHWQRGSFASSPWAATASAGDSGSRALSEATNPPSAGTAVNGFTPALFDGTNDVLFSPTGSTDLWTASEYSYVLLAKPITAAAPTGSGAWADEQFLGDANAYIGLAYTTLGLKAHHYNGVGSGVETTAATAATGSYHMMLVYYDGTTLRVDVNAGVSVGSATVGSISGFGSSGAMRIGRGNAAGSFSNVEILEVMTSKVNLSPYKAGLKSYFNARYGLSL